jgi:hypothetical protein
MEEIRNAFWWFLIIKKISLKFLKIGFNRIKSFSVLVKKTRMKKFFKKVSRDKGKIAWIMNWIFRTGRINVQQRGFIRWKINVFPLLRPRHLMFKNSEKFLVLKSFLSVSNLFLTKLKFTYLSTWKDVVMKSKQLKFKENQIKSKLLSLFIFFNNRLSTGLNHWKKWSVRQGRIKEKFRLIKKLFLKNFQKSFDNFCSEEYYYESYYIETVVRTDKITKSFKIMQKPVSQIEFHDIHFYDPAYRAVSRNLNHFLKKKKSFFLKIWKKAVLVERISSQSLAFYLQGSQTQRYQLDTSTLTKLKKLLIQFSLIQSRRSEMPEKCLTTWAAKSHLNLLKTLKFKILVEKTQKLYSNLRVFLNKWKLFQKSFHMFTDIE